MENNNRIIALVPLKERLSAVQSLRFIRSPSIVKKMNLPKVCMMTVVSCIWKRK